MPLLTLFLVLAAQAAPPGDSVLSGKILEDHTGNPLASASVRIYRTTPQTTLLADLETDTDGRFQAPGLPAGDYRLEISKPNFVSATLRRHIDPAVPIVARLVRCGVISGQVIDAQGQPVRATVFAMVRPAGSSIFQPHKTSGGSMASTDVRGRYRLYGLPPGEYTVAVWFPVGVAFYPNNEHPKMFSVSGGEEYPNTDFSLVPTGRYSVSGTVAVPRDGSVALALTPTGQPSLAVAKLQTRRDNRFQFEGIPPGSYELFAAYPSLGTGDLDTAVLKQDPQFGRVHVDVGGQNVEGLAISMSDGRTASFGLRAGAACSHTASVSLTPAEDWGAMLRRTVEINSASPVLVDHLAPGRYIVTVNGLGESCFSLANPVLDLARAGAAETIAIDAAPAASIRGKLVGLDSARPSDFSVVLLPSGSIDGSLSVQMVVPDAEGRFAFGPLRPGKYRIAASKSRLVPDLARMIELDLPGGSPTDIDLPVPK